MLGAHDLTAVEVQRATVKAVYSQPYDGSYPPLHDLSLLYLSVPARIGITPHSRPQVPNPGNEHHPVLHCIVLLSLNEQTSIMTQEGLLIS